MSDARRESVIRPAPIANLRPTQMTVGMREVERKLNAWKGKDADGKAKTLESHMVPIVLGPGGARYITDHHHLARALLEDGQKEVFVTLVGDLSKSGRDQFWNLMDYHGWTHPFDEKGRRCDYDDLPEAIEDLKDDPYRSLAGALRRAGGFAKDSTPYSEFVWADFFRSRVKRKDLTQDFDAKFKEAFALAKSAEADFLPGWCGPHDDDAKPARRRKAA